MFNESVKLRVDSGRAVCAIPNASITNDEMEKTVLAVWKFSGNKVMSRPGMQNKIKQL